MSEEKKPRFEYKFNDVVDNKTGISYSKYNFGLIRLVEDLNLIIEKYELEINNLKERIKELEGEYEPDPEYSEPLDYDDLD